MSTLSRVIFDPDTTPPSVPTGLTGVVNGQNRIDLSWNASTDTGGSGLAGYDILKDTATTIQTGVQTSYSDTGLAAGSTHTYRVRSRDGNGNLSAYGNQISGTTQGASSSSDYAWIDSPVGYTDYWVDPARVTTGAGTQVNPYSWNQMMTLNPPAGGRHRFIVMPGQLSVTTAQSSSKFPAIQPTWSGTAENPVLLKAQFPATRSSTQSSQMTVIRRTAGVGSLFGTFNSANYWRVDGLKFAGGNGSQGADGGNEKANMVLRNCTGWWVTRCWVDGEQADHTSQPSTNGAAIYMQQITQIRIQDVILENMGSPTSAARIWQGIEWYDGADIDISYFTVRNCYGLGVFQKGIQFGPQFQRNYIHHGIVSACADTCYHPYYVSAGSDPANHNYWYNLVADQRGVSGFSKCFLLNAIVPHQGTHVQNCTFIGGREAVSFVPSQYTADISFDNNVWYQNVDNIVFQDGPAWGLQGNNLIQWDWNQYSGQTGAMVQVNTTLNNLSQWQASPYLKDANATNAAPSFVNFAGGDFRTNGPAVAPDRWVKFGGGTIPRGAFEPYGCRRDQ